MFRHHPDCYDEEAFELLQRGQSPFDFDGLHDVSGVAESKGISGSDRPCVVIAGSGMCEGGRVLHHLQGALGPRATAFDGEWPGMPMIG